MGFRLQGSQGQGLGLAVEWRTSTDVLRQEVNRASSACCLFVMAFRLSLPHVRITRRDAGAAMQAPALPPKLFFQ